MRRDAERKEREREKDGGRKSREVGKKKKREADWHPVKEKRPVFELQTVCHRDGNPSVTPLFCCVGRLSH